jgi:hypothetical protein
MAGASTPQTGDYRDLVAAGIIDPTKVVRVALEHAASIAGLVITAGRDGGRVGAGAGRGRLRTARAEAALKGARHPL